MEPISSTESHAVVEMLDHHDNQVRRTILAKLTLWRPGRVPRWDAVGVPVAEDMERHRGRGREPTLSLCRLVDGPNGMQISRVDLHTINGDQLDALYAHGVVVIDRYLTVELLRAGELP